MSLEPKHINPVDQRSIPIYRAMGLPILQKSVILGDDTNWAILYDLSASKYRTRVFQGLSIENTSQSSRVILAWVEELMDTPNQMLDVGTQQFLTLDYLAFGPGTIDDSEEKRLKYILGRLDVAQGTQATGTIDYSGSGQPADQETVTINGIIYEFSDDASKQSSSDYIVTIGASADDTWTNFVTQLNLTQRYVVGSINTGTDVVTLTAIEAGTRGDAITMATSGSATLSGATLGGGAGGVTPICHIW